ncbi:MAG: molybdopterin-binding protein [Lachnospirales bacterium]
MGIIKAICISKERGTLKYEIEKANFIENFGIENDAHGGNWHRQISLLSFEEIEKFRKKGADIKFGSFGENLVVEGFDLKNIPVGSRFKIGSVILEVTQIGKECHSHCEIYKKMGECIMPREGIFAKVITGGVIKVGDEIILTKSQKAYTASVITLSDKGYSGERKDLSGPLAVDILKEAGYEVIEYILLPDDKSNLIKEFKRLADQRQVNLIITTGGTGFSPRDITPEATIAVCDRMARGIAEAIRAYSMTITKRAMLSRAESGIRGRSIIINLPGSPKACKESLEYVLPYLKHGIDILTERESECGRK